MYIDSGSFEVKLWSFPFVKYFVESFWFYLSSWKHVIMLVEFIVNPFDLYSAGVTIYYATVKRPALFPLLHTLM